MSDPESWDEACLACLCLAVFSFSMYVVILGISVSNPLLAWPDSAPPPPPSLSSMFVSVLDWSLK